MDTGDQIPEFSAVDQNGDPVTLSGLVADGPIVLFFYPKAMTTGCTAESCHFRDLRAEFAEVGATPVGISTDSPTAQKKFDEKHELGMTLIADRSGEVAKIFGTKRPLLHFVRRQTFVIDADRRLLGVIKSEMNMEMHADRALELLRSR